MTNINNESAEERIILAVCSVASESPTNPSIRVRFPLGGEAVPSPWAAERTCWASRKWMHVKDRGRRTCWLLATDGISACRSYNWLKAGSLKIGARGQLVRAGLHSFTALGQFSAKVHRGSGSSWRLPASSSKQVPAGSQDIWHIIQANRCHLPKDQQELLQIP